MRYEDTDRQESHPRSPLDWVRDASIGLTLIGFFGQWFPQGIVQVASILVMGLGLLCAVAITILRRLAEPCIGGNLDNVERKALLRLRETNRETTGIVFQRTRSRWYSLLARVAGHSYREFGYGVFMQCPERLWGHGGIGQVLALTVLQGDDFDLMVRGGGPVGKLEAVGRMREFVESHDRRFAVPARGLLELEKSLRSFHDDAQQLLLPDAKAIAQSVTEIGQVESAEERVEALTYQLTSIVMAADFIQTVHYRLMKTDQERMSAEEIVAQPGYQPPAKFASLPLLIPDGTRVQIDHLGLVGMMIAEWHRALVLGWVAGQRGEVDNECLVRMATQALNDVQEHPVSSLQELAELVLMRFDEINSNEAS